MWSADHSLRNTDLNEVIFNTLYFPVKTLETSYFIEHRNEINPDFKEAITDDKKSYDVCIILIADTRN